MDIIGAPSATKGGSLVVYDVLVVLGFILAVVAVLALGIYLGFRVKRDRREQRERQIQGLHLSDHDDDRDRDRERSGKRRVRRRRRDHRPRNPTLAEAGGLPPKRANGAAPPTPMGPHDIT
jgi:hypothetical protein